jgi:hypothetical protein
MTHSPRRLKEWKRAPRHDVTLQTARDRRTKFMLQNSGQRVVIIYKGLKKTIRPQKVFTVPGFRKSYLIAKVGFFGFKKTFDIDDIEKWKLPGFLKKWNSQG